ncbi:ribosome-associated ATPase/putative transporter RbbA [Kaistia dalseonensis]|uniref:Ribosome-dependent ATPase n=1 Tax=Kaistia dalseonensis TaxID=410840 RepID=A0ABU0H837_9HYPH|nr:ribosome-associated ATPase/putative transporter RbbA [Kaistia dalseonensis]MCX5495872.1 ribosome-associated ATPase/putative transporter RbbA [Kaistia dalseonensis]MDQ0438473.1 ribosome-dependent ATPase [Kaistia dalseonensis]
MSEPVIRFDGVSHRYGDTLALDQVSVAIPAGVMAGLIGPDGVGKSSLLALAAGVRRIQSGNVVALGGDMADRSHRRASQPRIAYMPQGLGRNLYPTLSIVENLDFFGRLFGQGSAERSARIKELLVATGLEPFGDRAAGKLSGGMKQKLGLCTALIHDPDLLVLDEPTTGVDPLSRRQFWDLVDRIRERRPGMSVLVATAYMEEAERFDWLAAMHSGKVIADGSAAALKEKTGQPTLDRAFISLLPEASADAQPVVVPPRPADGAVIAIEADGLTCRFGDFTAVDHVSFKIERGEIFGFLGSNGCGKSTTMKMLTGLQPPTEGEAKLFGKLLDAKDMATRQRVGYMSQSFSLYSELTVRQNLELHAEIFQLPKARAAARIQEMFDRFELGAVADATPEALPLGMRQRLQLAAAILHEPELLILDEPTSGVDPIARDIFWRYLIELSRNDGVTIFLSTHFMDEAERCDRISLMHAGRVLAVGSPDELRKGRQMATLEDAFIAYLEDAGMGTESASFDVAPAFEGTPAKPARFFDPGRLWACCRREATEILRDPLRLAFALLGPLLLLVTFGYGISFDVEHLPFAVFDQDQSAESRQLLEAFQGSRYFDERAPITSSDELDRRMRSGELSLAIEIPPDFGRDLLLGNEPEVGIWVDGAMPFRAETTRGYISGISVSYLVDQYLRTYGTTISPYPVNIETRYRYNQDFKSINAIVPSVIMLMLVLIPAIMTAISVVMEKESGSIANFRSTPVTRLEFLAGKQLPYIAIAFASFLTMLLASVLVFGVPFKGSLLTLLLASLLNVMATTSFGLFISSFTKTQVAAIFATAIIAIVPAVNFAGLLVPVSSLSGGGRLLGLAFPAAWYQPISVGTFTKGLGLPDLWINLVVLGLFAVGFLTAAVISLRKQEA